MKKTITTMAMGIIAATLLLTSCTKDGATGPAGPAGTNGTNGKNGSANVSTQDFYVTTWSSNSTNWYTSFNVIALTQSAQDSGAIEVFYSYNGLGTVWSALPYTYNSGTANFYTMGFNTIKNQVTITWTYNNGLGSDPNTSFGVNLASFKVVVIPPGMRKRNVNHNSYAEVKAAYKL